MQPNIHIIQHIKYFIFNTIEERRIEFQQTRIDEESHESKLAYSRTTNVERVSRNGRVIKYIMSPVPKLEPAMPRRKKYPDLAYRHHEFVPGEARNHHDAADGGSADRARVTMHDHLSNYLINIHKHALYFNWRSSSWFLLISESISRIRLNSYILIRRHTLCTHITHIF